MNKFDEFLIFHKKGFLNLILFLVFLWSLFQIPWGENLIHPGGSVAIRQIFQGMITPDLSAQTLEYAVIASIRTVAYAVTGMSVALLIAMTLGVLASGVLFKEKRRSRVLKSFFRGILGFMRAIHELVWAWLFVAAIGLSPYAAVFALGIPYGGTLGRVFADMLEDVPKEPISSLESAGANKLQVLFYGYLPIAKADMISYGMYRFECAIRSSTIMSFIGLGGLGYQIQMALSDLSYSRVWTYLYFLILLVFLIDLWSNGIRKRETA